MVENFYESLGFSLLEVKHNDNELIKYYSTNDLNVKQEFYIKEE